MKLKLSIIILLFTVVSFAGFRLILAEGAGEGLTISPPISEVAAIPGKKISKTIRLTNPTKEIVTVYPRVMDFGAKGEGGEPSFFEPQSESSKYSMARWIGFSQSQVALAPEQVVEFNYVINVPTDAEPGGHYGVIFFATEPPTTEGQASTVSLGSMIGSLVLARVPGQITEMGKIDDFTTNKPIYMTGAVDILTRISNLGNVHFKPVGNIVIKNMFGAEVGTVAFNEQQGNVLPDSTRKFTNNYQPKALQLGRYTATATLVYGEAEKTLTATQTFWLFPWWLVVIVLLIIVLSIGYVVYVITLKSKRSTAQKGSKNKPHESLSDNDNDRPILR